MCRILHVLEGSVRLNVWYLTRLQGSGRLNRLYFTCLEAQNVDKYITFVRFWGRMAPGAKINRILRVWKALGGSTCSILRVWKALGGSNCGILRAWKALGG